MPIASLRLIAGAALSFALAGAANAQMAPDHMSGGAMAADQMAAGHMDNGAMAKPMSHGGMSHRRHKRHAAGGAMQGGVMSPGHMEGGAMSSGAMSPH